MFWRTENKRKGKHSKKSRRRLWRGILSAVLCVAFLGTNVGGAFSMAAAETLLGVAADAQEDTGEGLLNVDGGQETEDGDSSESLEELPPDSGSCVHHLAHDEACGYTEENPVCTFVCAICAVQRQIDALLAQNAEEPDEAVLEQIRAAKEAYQALSPEEQAQIVNADALFAVLKEEQPEEADQTPNPSGDNLCTHHPAHDAACGYTEENPVCTFLCAVCPVQQQIDDVLARLEQVDPETLDEAATMELYEELLAAKRAYEGLEPEQQTQIDADKIDKLLAFVETFAIQTLETPEMNITAVIRTEGAADQSLNENSEFSVDFSKQFTLHIVVKSTLNLPNKKVEITVPDGLTVVEYPIPERGGMAESVTPENIDKLNSANNYGGYCPQNGTITYSLKNTAEENSFNIILAPDTTLWNRNTEQKVGELLTIRTYTGDIGDTSNQIPYDTISATPKITGKYNDKVGDNRAIQTGPRLSRVGVKTGVPAAANQPFALRQIWINPDKDYIDMPQFFKKLEITIALPYYTKNGSNIYAEFDHVTYDPAGQSTRPNLLDPENHKEADGSYKDGFNFKKTQNDIDHTVTLTWTNLYLEYGQDYFTPYFKWTSDCDVTTTNAVKWGSDSILNTGKTEPGCYEGKTPTTGDASAVGGTITWQDDSTWYLYNGDCTTFSFTAQAGESMSVNGKANNQPIYNNYAGDSDIIYYLGQFHVVNQGGAASADKTVEFTYANNDEIGVTAQKIPATTGNAVEVWYTTTTNPTEQKYNSSLTSSGGFVTFTAQMAGLGKGEYFTKIKANVGSYEKDYVGYVSSRDQDPTSGYATTFGKLLTADEATYSNFASMKMYDTGSNDSTAKSGNYTVKVTNTRGEIPLAMEQAYKEGTLERVPVLSKTSATAGDTITFNGLLSSSAYPYSSNNVTTDQEIYIRLPEKITVENLKLYQEVGRIADKVFLLDAVVETVMNPQRTEIPETAYKFEEVTSAAAAADDATATGYKLYKITFTNEDNPVKVGWFTDGLGQYQIGISFDMNIAKDADAMTLDMRDCVRFKSASLASTSNNGTLAQYQVMDDGVRYSTFNVNAAGTKLSVVAARLGLTFTFGARITEKGSTAEFDTAKYSNFEVDKNTVYLKDANHVVDLLFTLKNETGRKFSEEDAHAFYYFIPVPKNGDLWDSHMQEQAFEFDMSLTRAPGLWGISAEHILVTYATEIESTAAAGTDKHYTNTANYKTEEQLLAGCTTDKEKAERWREVKMIRIAAKPGIDSIPKNAELKVNMRLEPMFEDNANLVGSEINFGPCGVSPYSVGNTLNQGHNPLPRIQVEFQTGVIGGKIFIDKNFNGTYEKDTDELYTGSVTVEANHSNGNESCTEGDAAHKATASGGKFKFTGRRADTYHVTVTNPGSTDANGKNPLKFSLPESGGKFSLDAGKNTATASVVLDMNKTPNDIKDAQSLLVGFQRPHTVTFETENASLKFKDENQTNILTALFAAAKSTQTKKVWHGEALGNVVQTVTADSGWKFTGNWKDGMNTYTTEQLQALNITEDKTFTAEVKKLYSVSYDLNGGSGANAPETSTHIEGEKVSPDYTDTGKLKKGEDTIFVGWSETQIANPLPEDAAQDDINKIISHDEHIMPAHDVILYAVYAVDANGNGNPDYNDASVHVRYHGNNGDYTDILCPHHHVVGGKAALSTSGKVSGKSLGHDEPASAASGEVTSHTFTFTDKTTGNAHIFIGWSTSPILDTVIKTKADYDRLASSIVTKVTMEKAKVDGGNADADGNTNVYAVWAADRNGNKTADYLEEYTLTYDSNAQQGGTVSGSPTDLGVYIPGDTATLSEGKPTHSEVNSKKVVFIGWTENQTSSIFSRADTAPATVREITFGSANKTVYAAWGYDENGDGTADVLETYTLTYDPNGGIGAVTPVTDIKKNTQVTLETGRNLSGKANELFVGWSKEQKTTLTEDADENEVEGFLFIPGSKYLMGTENVTFYAVWAKDADGNGIPDYKTRYIVRYDPNGGTGTYTPDTVFFGQMYSVKAAPTREGYSFTGWQDQYGETHQPGQNLSSKVDLILTAQWKEVSGGGESGGSGSGSGSGGSTYYILHWQSNGGTEYGDAQYAGNTVARLDRVPVREGYTFTGWYADAALTQRITEIRMNENKTVYAGWEPTDVPQWLNGETHFAYVFGYEDGTVHPLHNISRAEVAAIFFRLLDGELRDGNLTASNTFADVQEGDWYNTSVSTMARLGILRGRTGDCFDPGAPITRAEFAAICARFDTSGISGGSSFTDISGHWAQGEIARAAALGWIRGYEDGTFRPENYITRAEAMTMINRMLNRLPQSEADLLKGMKIWSDNKPGTWYYLTVQEATNSHAFTRKDDVHEQWTKLTADEV